MTRKEINKKIAELEEMKRKTNSFDDWWRIGNEILDWKIVREVNEMSNMSWIKKKWLCLKRNIKSILARW